MIDQFRTVPRPPVVIALGSIIMGIIAVSYSVWGVSQVILSDAVTNSINLILLFLSAGIACTAAKEYWLQETGATLLHFIVVVQSTILLILSSGTTHWIYLGVSIGSALLLVLTMFEVHSKPLYQILGLGLILTCLSFYFQQAGPSMGSYRTECADQSQSGCTGAIYGAGFPFQYVLDFTGGSVIGQIGFEDRFISWAFLADVAVYSGIIYGGLLLVNKAKQITR